jgi:hypothetical protein
MVDLKRYVDSYSVLLAVTLGLSILEFTLPGYGSITFVAKLHDLKYWVPDAPLFTSFIGSAVYIGAGNPRFKKLTLPRKLTATLLFALLMYYIAFVLANLPLLWAL